MSKNEIFEKNRKAWNEALKYHQKASGKLLKEGFNDSTFTIFERDCDDISMNILNKFDFAGKTISQLPCNNGRELLSILKIGAEKAVGFDISDNAIAQAKELTKIGKLNAEFIRTNILDISKDYNSYFDFIYISEGSLQWFPDLKDYFNVVSRLLKNGGDLFIFEIHLLRIYLKMVLI